MICLLGRSITVFLLLDGLVSKRSLRSEPERVDALARRWQVDFHHVLAIGTFNLLHTSEIFGGAVVTEDKLENVKIKGEMHTPFGSPSNVMAKREASVR
jgi:hypothetical protein